MLKKAIRIFLNIVGSFAALVLPTMIEVTVFLGPTDALRARLILLQDPLLLVLLIIFSLLSIRKSLHFNLIPLYVSVVGYLISARMTPIVLPFFNENSRYGQGFGGASLQTALLEMIVAIPLACAALAAAILLTRKYKKKKAELLDPNSHKPKPYELGPHDLDFSLEQ